MAFVWHEAKRLAKLEKHGLDFRDAAAVYANPLKVTYPSPRGGEGREVAIAMVKAMGSVLLLVYVVRGRNVHVISFRKANRRERKAYEAGSE